MPLCRTQQRSPARSGDESSAARLRQPDQFNRHTATVSMTEVPKPPTTLQQVPKQGAAGRRPHGCRVCSPGVASKHPCEAQAANAGLGAAIHEPASEVRSQLIRSIVVPSPAARILDQRCGY